jgi:hypothetical protein
MVCHAWIEEPPMGEHAELREHARLGRLCVDLLVRLVDEEARRLPDLRPASGVWTSDDVEDLAHEYYTDKGEQVTATLLAVADSDGAVGRILRVSVRNWLRDQARKIGTGPLRERIKKLLRNNPNAFEQVSPGQPGAGYWHLRGSEAGPTAATTQALAAAAHAVPDIAIPRWRSEDRTPPFASGTDIQRILHAIFTAAGGSVSIAALTSVFAERFPRALSYEDEPFDPTDEVRADPDATDPGATVVDLDESRHARELAETIYARMSPDERRLLPVLSAGVGEQQQVTGLGRSATYQRVAALRARLVAWLGPEEDRHQKVVRFLIELCSPVDVSEGVSSCSSDSDAPAQAEEVTSNG